MISVPRRVILASKSPRRRDLLELFGIDFEIAESNVYEENVHEKNPRKLVKILSYKKAKEVSRKADGNSLVIAADTIVVLGNAILGKPKNEQHAFEMLKKLNGRRHVVYTSMTLFDTKTREDRTVLSKTVIKFNRMTDNEIVNYIRTGEPLDKAGAYGIQGVGGMFVKKIRGDYYAVMGLSISKLFNELKKIT